MNESKPTPALKMAVMWHGAAILPTLRALSFEKRRQIMREVTEVSGELPLHVALSQAELARLSFPSWRDGAQLSGAQTMALMVFCLWVQMGERDEHVGSLCEFWPVKEAVLLATTGSEV